MNVLDLCIALHLSCFILESLIAGELHQSTSAHEAAGQKVNRRLSTSCIVASSAKTHLQRSQTQMERLDDTTSATQSVVPPKAGKKVEIVRP